MVKKKENCFSSKFLMGSFENMNQDAMDSLLESMRKESALEPYESNHKIRVH